MLSGWYLGKGTIKSSNFAGYDAPTLSMDEMIGTFFLHQKVFTTAVVYRLVHDLRSRVNKNELKCYLC